MKVYLAASYGRRLELAGYAAELKAGGIEVVSTWVDGHHETRPDIDERHSLMEAARWAREDLHDVDRADALILFTNPEGGYRRGGCMVQFGYALARDLSLYVVGPRDNVFTKLPQVGHFERWADLRDTLAVKRAAHGEAVPS